MSKTKLVQAHVPPAFFTAIKKAAARADMTVAAWVRKTLKEACVPLDVLDAAAALEELSLRQTDARVVMALQAATVPLYAHAGLPAKALRVACDMLENNAELRSAGYDRLRDTLRAQIDVMAKTPQA